MFSLSPSLSLLTAFGGLYLLLPTCARALHRKLVEKQTGLADIPFLGEARAKDRKIKGTAVVCGGSVAGLVTARVCHDHFERVIIIEPESSLVTPEGWEPEKEPRKRTRARVLQYQSLHGLLAFGFMALEKLFPGIREECEESDIRVGPADFRMAFDGHFFNLGDRRSLENTAFSTRHGFETLLRRLIMGKKQYPNIEQMVGTVTGVFPSDSDPTTLQAVSVRTGDGDRIIDASLIIDCSGVAQAGLKWLQRAGFGADSPHSQADDSESDNHAHLLRRLKLTYDPQIIYTTFQFTIPPSLAERLPIPGGYHNSTAIYMCFSQIVGTAFGMTKLEGDTIVICCATRVTEPPRTLDELKAFVANALMVDEPVPEWVFRIFDELSVVEDSMSLSRVQLPLLSYVRYHQARGLPNNCIAIGDSIMKVNPIYGHGYAKAIIGAATLHTVLRAVDTGNRPTTLPANFSKLFFDAQAAKIEPIWETTKTIDYGYQTTIPVSGESLSAGQFARWYSHRLTLLAFSDQLAGMTMWRTMHLLSPALDAMSPRLVLKILWDVFRRPHA